MPTAGRKVIMASFALATVIWISLMIRTYGDYYSIYSAIRTLSITVTELNVKWIDSTRAQTVTVVNVSNPSNSEFLVLGLDERITLDSTFVSYGRAQINMMTIPPQSSSNITVILDVPYQFNEILQEPAQKTWLARVWTSLEGPLVGRFNVQTSKQVVTL